MGYFYCSSRDASGQDLDVALRMLLMQLSPPTKIPKPLSNLFKVCTNVYPPRTPTLNELGDCLRDVVALHAEDTDVSLCWDGIDELPLETRPHLYSIIKNLVGLQQPRVHLLVTSQDHADIRGVLSGSACFSYMPILDTLVRRDVEVYIENVIRSDHRLSSLSSQMRQEILDKIVVQSDGM